MAVRHAPLMYPCCVRFLGIDYGNRRIGLALSDATGMLARPWKTLARTGNPAQVAVALASEIARLRAEEDGLAGVVLGLPRKLGGEPTDQTAVVQALAGRLRPQVGIPLVLQDERLTSREAESLLSRRIKSWRDRRPLLDAAAAAVILQDYLDSRLQEDSSS
jgi:putative holliday junction resolvase